MADARKDEGLHPGWWTLFLLVLLIAAIWLTYALFAGTLKSFVPVTLTSDRAGLVMESNAKVKMRGVQVGRVASITGGREPVELKLEIDPDQIKHIPANVEAQIRATTVFGAKFVDLVYPSDPSAQRLEAGQVLQSRNVATEVNTVFENVVGVLDQIDTAKLNSVLSALAQGVRGKGERIGQATTDANQVFLALNPRSETVRADWQALKGFSDTYSVAAQDILTTLNAASTTSVTITNRAKAAGCVAAGHHWLLQQWYQPARTESGQPDQGHQRARADDEPVDEVQPGVHLPAGRRQDVAGQGRLRSARRQRILDRLRRRPAFAFAATCFPR